MSSKILRKLFVIEGITEKTVVKSLKSFFFSDSIIIECIFDAEVYQLYDKLSKDKDLTLFGLLKERNPDVMSEWEEDDFPEIFLFFDYDGQATGASNLKMIKLLEMFYEESDRGKLYISYPCVESLKDIPDPVTFYNLSTPAQGTGYKQIVGDRCNVKLQSFNKYNLETWKHLIMLHLMKMNYIVEDSFSLPNRVILQSDILSCQIDNFIVPNQHVSILSAFPVFIHDYFGNERTLKLIQSSDEDKI